MTLTRQDVAKGVAVAMRCHPSAAAKLTPGDQQKLIDAWHPMLNDMEPTIFEKALARCLQSSEFLPSVAAIRKAAAALVEPDQDVGLKQWGEVLRAIGRVGAHRPAPTFADPITDQCVRSLGWAELCASENATADRARFIEAYNSIAATRQREAALSPQLRAGAAAPEHVALPDAIGDVMKRIGGGQ